MNSLHMMHGKDALVQVWGYFSKAEFLIGIIWPIFNRKVIPNAQVEVYL